MTTLADKLSTRRISLPEQEPITLHRRRIYVLPTRHGLLFAVLLIVMLIGSINYNNSLGFILTFLMGSVALISMLHTHRNLSGLEITSIQTHSVFSGQYAVFDINISNTHKTDKLTIVFNSPALEDVAVDIRSGLSVTVGLKHKTTRRGKLNPGYIKVSTVYPLGLFRAWSWIAPDNECIVYPTAEEDAPPPRFAQAGNENSTAYQQNGEEELYEIRSYRHGDPIRSIAWKQSARTEGLLSKTYHAPSGTTEWLEWKQLDGVPLEQKLSRLCRWILDCEQQGIQYGLRMPDGEIPPGSGHKHRHVCLSRLALYQAG